MLFGFTYGLLFKVVFLTLFILYFLSISARRVFLRRDLEEDGLSAIGEITSHGKLDFNSCHRRVEVKVKFTDNEGIEHKTKLKLPCPIIKKVMKLSPPTFKIKYFEDEPKTIIDEGGANSFDMFTVALLVFTLVIIFYHMYNGTMQDFDIDNLLFFL